MKVQKHIKTIAVEEQTTKVNTGFLKTVNEVKCSPAMFLMREQHQKLKTVKFA